ncbi:hypothetical protein [uncultured Methanobrevibacter sp.]|nr:hypothetical protein [uncultured Methanobrevibacter sp.]
MKESVKGEIKYFVAIVSDKYHEIAVNFHKTLTPAITNSKLNF